MSGAFGWGGNDRRTVDDVRPSTTVRPGGGFSKAVGAYNSPPVTPSQVYPATSQTQGPSRAFTAPTSNVETYVLNRKLTCDADNVLVVCLDGTGSMGTWRDEILARVRLLFEESKEYLGGTTQIIAASFGDIDHGDRVEVTKPGAGPELDEHFSSLCMDFVGGGNSQESPEMLAYYLSEQVDFAKAKNVFCFFITDEKAGPAVRKYDVTRHLGLNIGEDTPTKNVFQRLLLKAEVFCVFANTGSYQNQEGFRQDWNKHLPERVLPLDDGRRVVDVMLAAVAMKLGQFDKFQRSFMSRNQGSQYAAQNFSTVQKSVAIVAGSQKLHAPSTAMPSRFLQSVQKTPGSDT